MSVGGSPAIFRHVLSSDLKSRDEPAMLLVDNREFAFAFGQFEHDDGFAGFILHELNRDRPGHEQRELVAAEGQILHHLPDVDLIFPTFRLHGDDELIAGIGHRDVDFVGFDLADFGNGCAQMVLYRYAVTRRKRSMRRL